jgi:two-component system OmpR family response regulator
MQDSLLRRLHRVEVNFGLKMPIYKVIRCICGIDTLLQDIVKILIVEDDRMAAHVYGQWLLKAGYEVKVAKTGPEAVAQAGLWAPDAILLDIMLPDLNGIAVLKLIRGEAPKLPAIVCTNAYTPGIVEQALAAGATRIFDKSRLTSLDLVAEFDGVLGRTASKRRAA